MPSYRSATPKAQTGDFTESIKIALTQRWFAELFVSCGTGERFRNDQKLPGANSLSNACRIFSCGRRMPD